MPEVLARTVNCPVTADIIGLIGGPDIVPRINFAHVMSELAKVQAVEGGEVVVVGKNGDPLGKDIAISTEPQVRQLCEIAGWFAQKWNWEEWIHKYVGAAEHCQ